MTDRSGQFLLFILAALAVFLSFTLEVERDRTVLPVAHDTAMPRMCLVHAFTGHDCPLCGLTRGFVHLAHGRLWEASAVNATAPAAFVFVLLQVPYRLYFMSGKPKARARGWLLTTPWVLVACGLIASWVFKLTF
ncbi:MAG: DUF2752 domain-containing protein [bacterium]